MTKAKLVQQIPFWCTGIFQAGSFGHITQMIRERSAEGQSLGAWCGVLLALALWLVYYYDLNPKPRTAILATWVSLAIDSLVVLTIVYVRYLQ